MTDTLSKARALLPELEKLAEALRLKHPAWKNILGTQTERDAANALEKCAVIMHAFIAQAESAGRVREG